MMYRCAHCLLGLKPTFIHIEEDPEYTLCSGFYSLCHLLQVSFAVRTVLCVTESITYVGDPEYFYERKFNK